MPALPGLRAATEFDLVLFTDLLGLLATAHKAIRAVDQKQTLTLARHERDRT